MSELEKLREQKREIEARIRELKQKNISAGVTRIGVEHYPTQKPDRWYLAIDMQYIDYPYFTRHSSQYRTVINAKSKEDIIEEIPNLIKDLQDLYNTAKQE